MKKKNESSVTGTVLVILGLITGFYGFVDLVLLQKYAVIIVSLLLFIAAIYFELRTK